MIKASELRIGNHVRWYYGDNQEVIGKVYAIEEDKIAISNWEQTDEGGRGRGYMMLTGINPIPLTEEWMLKFGFKLKSALVYEINMGTSMYRLKCILPKESACTPVVINDYPDGKNESVVRPIKYVHQLQNLYFAITGEELTIKEI